MKRLAMAAACAALAAVTFSTAAQADIVGTYVVGDATNRQSMTLSYKDDQHIRMDVGQGSYMLVTGAKAYMVTQQGAQATVIDLDTLPKFALPAPKSAATGKAPTITKTGRTETVAGLKGEVYEIVMDNQRHEMVLSADKRALGLNKAFMALGKRMGQSLGAEMSAQIEVATREAAKYGYGGLLRSDQAMVLQSVADKATAAGHYDLPKGAAPMQMPKFDPAMMQQMQQQMQQMQQQMKQQGGR